MNPTLNYIEENHFKDEKQLNRQQVVQSQTFNLALGLEAYECAKLTL